MQVKWKRTLLQRNEDLVKEVLRLREENSQLRNLIKADLRKQLFTAVPMKSNNCSLEDNMHNVHVTEISKKAKSTTDVVKAVSKPSANPFSTQNAGSLNLEAIAVATPSVVNFSHSTPHITNAESPKLCPKQLFPSGFCVDPICANAVALCTPSNPKQDDALVTPNLCKQIEELHILKTPDNIENKMDECGDSELTSTSRYSTPRTVRRSASKVNYKEPLLTTKVVILLH